MDGLRASLVRECGVQGGGYISRKKEQAASVSRVHQFLHTVVEELSSSSTLVGQIAQTWWTCS